CESVSCAPPWRTSPPPERSTPYAVWDPVWGAGRPAVPFSRLVHGEHVYPRPRVEFSPYHFFTAQPLPPHRTVKQAPQNNLAHNEQRLTEPPFRIPYYATITCPTSSIVGAGLAPALWGLSPGDLCKKMTHPRRGTI